MYKILLILAVATGAACGAGSAIAVPPPPDPGDGTATAAKTDHEKSENLNVRYAQAEVALAEANLNKVRGMNERVPGAVSGDVVRAYELDLEVAKLQLQVASGGPEKQFDVWLARAEAAAKYAQSRSRGALAANARVKGAVDPSEVERLQASAELASLEVERGHAVAKGTPEAKLAWQLDLLNGQLHRVMEELRQTVPSSRVYLYDR